MPTNQELGHELARAVNMTGLAEVVRVSESKKQVSLLYRVKDKKQWLALMEYILQRKTCWEAHICQQYFLRANSLVYGWNFILQASKTLREAVEEVSKLVEAGQLEVPRARAQGQLSSFPLVGASPRRTASLVWDPRQPGPAQGGPSHKGAHSIK